ncbi:hypothetical protein LINGRAHAP2_LOCUS19548 [Linum grandiflorum]
MGGFASVLGDFFPPLKAHLLKVVLKPHPTVHNDPPQQQRSGKLELWAQRGNKRGN